MEIPKEVRVWELEGELGKVVKEFSKELMVGQVRKVTRGSKLTKVLDAVARVLVGDETCVSVAMHKERLLISSNEY